MYVGSCNISLILKYQRVEADADAAFAWLLKCSTSYNFFPMMIIIKN
jgi:hypothetical protein